VKADVELTIQGRDALARLGGGVGANLSAYWAYSASMRAGDGVVHGFGTTVTTDSEVFKVRAASAPRFSADNPPFPAR
jgi:hypothetical protein